jgi:hypothetical protein
VTISFQTMFQSYYPEKCIQTVNGHQFVSLLWPSMHLRHVLATIVLLLDVGQAAIESHVAICQYDVQCKDQVNVVACSRKFFGPQKSKIFFGLLLPTNNF